MLVELDSNKEKLRQREGWYHWVVAPHEDSESFAAAGPYPTSAGVGGAQEYFGGVGSPLMSAAPSEASDVLVMDQFT